MLAVAEDELTRLGLRLLLRSMDCVRHVAEAGGRGELLRARAELDYDVAVVDASHFGTDETLRLIDDLSALRSDSPVIVYTAEGKAVLDHCARRRVTGYCLARGRDSGSELRRGIEQVLELRSPQSNTPRQARAGYDDVALVASLTPREREVLRLVASGEASHRIAKALGVSLRTVESHRSGICTKLGVRSVAALTKVAVKTGLSSLTFDDGV